MRDITLEIVGCPECAAPAEVVDRFLLKAPMARSSTPSYFASCGIASLCWWSDWYALAYRAWVGPRHCVANVSRRS